jgi:hypothetical protein
MRAFFQGFPIWNALRTGLSWTHWRSVLRVGDFRACGPEPLATGYVADWPAALKPEDEINQP